MGEVLFNTNEVAKMLQVDKSTVKRWTEEKKLKCFRTPGGHRKFRAEDLYNFMAEYNYGVSTLRMMPQMASDEAIIKRIVTNKEYNVLHSVCFNAAIKGKKDEIITLFVEVYHAGLPLSMIFDHILMPTLKKMNDTLRANKISALENQLAITALSGAIVQLSDSITHYTKNEKIVICASLENEKSDVEFKAMTTLLEINGYNVLNLGLGMSPDIIAELIERVKPFAVCLYSHTADDEAKLKNDTERIISIAVNHRSQFISVGSGSLGEHLSEVKHCKTFAELDTINTIHSGVSSINVK
ncbi:MAG: helix-turn-helix domain-containing protein [Bacteroidota bacterium]|jgi:excisionase family DNA binding protein